MNFYVDSNGEIISVDAERVFQGSANANTIRFIGAFPAGASVAVSYRLPLPSGVVTERQLLSYNRNLSGIQNNSGVIFNVWEIGLGVKYVDGKYVPDYTILEYPGVVNVQFFVTQSNEKGEVVNQSTARSSFVVEIGNPPELPPAAYDDYEALLNQILAAISASESNKVNRTGDTMTGSLTVKGLEGANPMRSIKLSSETGALEVFELWDESGAAEQVSVFPSIIEYRAYNNYGTDEQAIAEYYGYILPKKSGTLALEEDLVKIDNNKVNKSGDTMTGSLTVGYIGEGENASKTRAVRLSGNSCVPEVLNGTDITEYYHDRISAYLGGKTIVLAFPASSGIIALHTDVKELRDSLQSQIDGIVHAYQIELSIDNQTYELTAALKKSGSSDILSAATVDLPLETMVVSGRFDEETNSVILTLQNGNEIKFSVAQLVDGLINKTTFEAFLATKGQANGFAGLDENGKVPKSQLPDDIGSSGDGTGDGISAKEFEELLIESLTNPTEEWTDEEKTATCETIGAVKQVAYDTTDGAIRGRVYVVDHTDTQTSKVLSIQAITDSVPLRDGRGNFFVSTPTLIYHCANKGYVDGLIAELRAEIGETDLSEIYDILGVAGLTATVELESTYDARPTAEGIPGALLPNTSTIVKSVKGNSVTTVNLLDYTKLQNGTYYTISSTSSLPGMLLNVKATETYESMLSNLGKFSDIIPTAKIGDTLYIKASGTAFYGTAFFIDDVAVSTGWTMDGNSAITVTKEILDGNISVSLVLNADKNTTINYLMVSKEPITTWHTYFSGIKHSQFNGIVSNGKNIWNPAVNSWEIDSSNIAKTNLIKIVGDEDMYLSIDGTPWAEALNGSSTYIKFYSENEVSFSTGYASSDGKIPISEYPMAVYFSVQCTLADTTDIPDFSKTQLEYTGVSAYEPYVESVLDFSNHDLSYLGMGSEIDFVDKVIRTKAVEIILTGDENVSVYTYTTSLGNCIRLSNILTTSVDSAEFICTDAVSGFASGRMSVGGTSSDGSENIYWYGILDKLGFTSPDAKASDEEYSTAIASFKTWLAQRYANGNPVTIYYVSSYLEGAEEEFSEEALAALNFVADEYGNNLGAIYTPFSGGVEYQEGNENAQYGANNTVLQDYEIVRKVGGDS